MSRMTRRQILLSGLAASAQPFLPEAAFASQPASPQPSGAQSSGAQAGMAGPRERLLLDRNWRFALGDANDPKKDFGFGELARERTFAKSGHIAQATAKFDDSAWRKVELPHDWAVELPFIATKPAPEQGGRPLGREFPETSIGWYRRSFSLAAEDAGKRIALEFDGIYRDAAVFLNGHYLTTNFSGYAPFQLDVTDWVNTKEPNVLAVRVDATLGDGWFYEGAGIYRHVWLIKRAPVHLVEWGTWVRPDVSGTAAVVRLGSEVENASTEVVQVHVEWTLLDPEGRTAGLAASAARKLLPGETQALTAEGTVSDVALWSIETPQLYRAVATVHVGGSAVDRDETTFGVRTVRFDADKGFFLNGKPVKIKGTCCHQDHAGVGVALPDRVQAYRVERLKSMGSNGLRTSHNPPTPELVDATDALGMVVMCETRMMDSSPEGLSQLERMIRRFRNHPSIVIWSLGNEEPEQGTERGQRIVTTMQNLAHRLDPTRVCTVAMNNSQGSGISYVVDVQGFNYSERGVDAFHRKFPAKPMIGTETASTVSTRGIYENDATAGYVSAYDLNAPSWATTAEKWWSFYDEREFLAGGFAWTGFDYRGEPTPYSWPCVSSHFGIMDVCGFPKDNYFYYKAWWGSEPVLHLFPHWNWPASKEGQPISVWVHSNLEAVELLVNGVSQGVKSVVKNQHLEWSVAYRPGAIEARGMKGGKVVLTSRRETTGEPAKIVLSADRVSLLADGEDVAMVAVEVQDALGRAMPIADNRIEFAVMGPGRLIGTGNGDPSSHEPDKASSRKVFNGWAQAIVQCTREAGRITVRATSAGLEGAVLVLEAKAARGRASVE